MNQNLPNDPVMLLSYVNTQLRDFYSDLDSFCAALDIDRGAIEKKLELIDYTYDAGTNQFI